MEKKSPKSSKGDQIATVHENEQGEISLKLPRIKFEDLLFGFLSNKETLKKTYRDNFTIKLDDLLQFHYLLSQKTELHRFISPKILTTEFQYSDHTTRILHNIESLERYVETKNVGVEAINMEWEFLLIRDDKDNIQKQKIALHFNSEENSWFPDHENDTETSITLRIEHTDPIWAREVQRLFEENIAKTVFRYNPFFNFLNRLNRWKVLSALVFASLLIIISGMAYIIFQRIDFTAPIKTEAELNFDLAEVVAAGEPGDEAILLAQFYLIRDLAKDKDIGTIRYLREGGYFRAEYSPVIDRMVAHYYNDKTASDRLFNSIESQLKQQRAIEAMQTAYYYLRWVILFLFICLICKMYLKAFRWHSIIAITDRGIRNLEAQNQRKAAYVQIFFGVGSSLVATVIVFWGEKLLYMK